MKRKANKTYKETFSTHRLQRLSGRLVCKYCLISDFDIFAQKPVQTSFVKSTEVTYKPIASVNQGDLEFLLPANNDKYIDLNIKLHIGDKLSKACGKNLDNTHFIASANKFLHSLIIPCSIAINGETVTLAADHYDYRSFSRRY